MSGVQLDERGLAGPIFMCLAIVAEYFFISLVIPMQARNKAFPYHWLKANFGEDHVNAFSEKIPKQGYPDLGDGHYGKTLSYRSWYELSVAQRTAYNYMEQLPIILFSTMVAGMVWWIPATCLAGLFFFGRILFTIGMTSSKGTSARFPGFAILMLGLFPQMILATVGCFRIAGLF